MQRKKENIAEIIHIVIASEEQGKGYSIAIGKEVINRLLQDGYRTIYIATNKENFITKNILNKFGFEFTNQKNYDGDCIFVKKFEE